MGLKSLLMASFAAFSIAAPSYAAEQRVRINLPAYELTLETIDGGKATELKYPITIGKGNGTKPQTPVGTGTIVEKRGDVIFTFADGGVIWWNRTYNSRGRPISYDVPYPELRGLGMLLTEAATGNVYDRYVIHSNLDEFTLGLASSNGCIRVGVEDMKALYDAIRPEQKMEILIEPLKNPVPVEIIYDILELEKDKLKLHANVYHFEIDPVEEFKVTVGAAGHDLSKFDYEKVRSELEAAQAEFRAVHEEINALLSNDFPKNYVKPELKEKLHKTFGLEEFLKK